MSSILDHALPPFFATHSAQGLTPAHISGHVPVAQFEVGDYKNFVYVILDWNAREALIVDPHLNLQSNPCSSLGDVFRALEQESFSICGIVLTHSHWDHIAGIEATRDHWTSCTRLWVHPLDRSRLEDKHRRGLELLDLTDPGPPLLNPIADIWHTPGHSAGGCTFFVKGPAGSPLEKTYVLTGDTLFIDQCGRTDLPTGSDADMFASLRRLADFGHQNPNAILLPGHHYAPAAAATFEAQLGSNPALAVRSIAELAALP